MYNKILNPKMDFLTVLNVIVLLTQCGNDFNTYLLL
jgi:hypothetical protein